MHWIYRCACFYHSQNCKKIYTQCVLYVPQTMVTQWSFIRNVDSLHSIPFCPHYHHSKFYNGAKATSNHIGLCKSFQNVAIHHSTFSEKEDTFLNYNGVMPLEKWGLVTIKLHRIQLQTAGTPIIFVFTQSSKWCNLSTNRKWHV